MALNTLHEITILPFMLGALIHLFLHEQVNTLSFSNNCFEPFQGNLVKNMLQHYSPPYIPVTMELPHDLETTILIMRKS